MAGVVFLEQQKAAAVAEAIDLVEELLDGPSEPLMRARIDATARSMPGFDVAVLAAELARVAAAQQERIEALERKVKNLAKKPAPGEAAGLVP